MDVLSLLLIAIGVAMDAFAVSICKGISLKKYVLRASLIVGLWFGIFQALMPLIGYYLGSQLIEYIEEFDHWIAFVLLFLIGFNMFLEAFKHEETEEKEKEKENENENSNSFAFKTMLILSIATSIDALTVGVTFAFFKVSLILAISLIFSVTFILSFLGVKIGYLFGAKYRKSALITGGIILVLIGIKILLEHLGILTF